MGQGGISGWQAKLLKYGAIYTIGYVANLIANDYAREPIKENLHVYEQMLDEGKDVKPVGIMNFTKPGKKHWITPGYEKMTDDEIMKGKVMDKIRLNQAGGVFMIDD